MKRFFIFQIYRVVAANVGRFRRSHEPAATANIVSNIVVPKGNASGIVLSTVIVATALAPPVSIAVTLYVPLASPAGIVIVAVKVPEGVVFTPPAEVTLYW